MKGEANEWLEVEVRDSSKYYKVLASYEDLVLGLEQLGSFIFGS